jgi:hypothetical protein
MRRRMRKKKKIDGECHGFSDLWDAQQALDSSSSSFV